jgi:hypothetical protein
VAFHLTSPLLGPALALPEIALGIAGRNDPGSILGMIKGDNPIIETKSEVRDLEFVVAWPRQFLKMVAEVVAKQPRGTPLKRRQVREFLAALTGQLLSQDEKRILVFEEWLGRRKMNLLAPRPQPFIRVSSDK